MDEQWASGLGPGPSALQIRVAAAPHVRLSTLPRGKLAGDLATLNRDLQRPRWSHESALPCLPLGYKRGAVGRWRVGPGLGIPHPRPVPEGPRAGQTGPDPARMAFASSQRAPPTHTATQRQPALRPGGLSPELGPCGGWDDLAATWDRWQVGGGPGLRRGRFEVELLSSARGLWGGDRGSQELASFDSGRWSHFSDQLTEAEALTSRGFVLAAGSRL